MRRRPTIALPNHVHCVVARGKTYYYYHPNRGTPLAGPRVRIAGEPDQPNWWRAYREAAGLEEPVTNPQSFNALIDAWQASPRWQKRLGHRTQVEWARYCQRIRDTWGNLEVAGITPRHVAELRDAWEGRAANNMIRCLSSMMRWGVERGFRHDNPCREIEKLDEGDPYKPWSWDVVEHVRDNIRADLWWAVAIAVYTGQRQGDVLAMRWDKYRNGLITLKQSKTGTELSIPVHRDLALIIENMPRRAMTMLTNTHGQPWSVSGFRATWRKHRPQVLIDSGLVFHGLRKTAVVTLLEVGCTDAEVASITGQSREMIEHYAKGVRQKILAGAAITRWENAKRT